VALRTPLLLLLGVLLAGLGLVGCTRDTDLAGEAVTVAEVVDGDTLRLTDGRRVRLVQIDAPEVDERECYGADATAALLRLAPAGTEVTLVRDPVLDATDRFDRLLRYVFAGGRNLNVELVSEGAAAPYFFGGGRGRYAARLLAAAEEAREDGAGLWGACPGAALDPERALDAGLELL
jgi:micrococcal nuclease